MNWQSFNLEPLEGGAPALIHEAEALEAAEQARVAAAEAEAAALAEEHAIEQRHAQLVSAMSAVANDIQAHRSHAVSALADIVAETLAETVPALAHETFVTELTIAVADVIVRAQIAEPRLCVPPQQHDAIVTALQDANPPGEVAVVSDGTLTPGHAKLTWDGGGAEFDAETLVETARSHFDRRRATLEETA